MSIQIIEITAKTRNDFNAGYQQGSKDAKQNKNQFPKWDEENDYQRGYRRGWCIANYWANR